MPHLEEFTSYKNTLMRAICTNQRIVDLIKKPSEPSTTTGADLRYKQIFPYNYVPLTTETATTYICFSVTAPSVVDNKINNLRLYVWVFTHQDLMRTDEGMRTDLLVSEIDKILNGNKNYGLGKVTLRSCDISGVPCEGYVGMLSVYSVKDFALNCGEYSN